MIENLGFSLRGFNEYTQWQIEDKRTLKKINQLIRDIIRNGNEGIGHPEPLKGNLAGYWIREIDEKNRLVYQILDGGRVEIYQCKGHYNDK
ncbi:MAG: Txe/YoeB family addiction module toxin [Defluviitaleaceae bacterium]|nr:Txe/YoeB family addiction module toxin [Defluviitaleaceae bacterium]MCL2238516.1 Txe/YoeB family addiction module toxin [Defluviitaleaceae bacterium]